MRKTYCRSSEKTILRSFENNLRAVTALCFLLGFTSVALAQNSGIVGDVKDQTGALVAGTELQLTEITKGLTQTAQSNGSGSFRFNGLAVGTYELHASHAGFASIAIRPIQIDVNQTARVEVMMKIATSEQTLTVSSQRDLIDTQTSENGDVIDNKIIQNVPVNGRDFSKLTLLTPGAQANVEGNLSGGVVIDGQRSTSNQYIIDGADTTVGGGSFAYRTPGSGTPQGASGTSSALATVDSIEEFKVQTSNFSAQYGTESGGIVNIVTKSGSNKFHGSIYDFLRDSKLDANDYFLNQAGIKKPPFTFNDIGGTIGGPVVHNKTFFFGNLDHLQENYSRGVNGTVLSRAARAAALPVMGPLIRFYPAPTGPDNPDGSAPYIGTAPSHGRENDFAVRVDHQIAPSDRIYGRYSFGGSNAMIGGGLGTVPLTMQSTQARIQTASMVETHTFSNSLINTLNIGYARSATNISAVLLPGPGTDGDPFGADGQPVQPQIAIGTISLAAGSSPSQLSYLNDFTYRDNLMWNAGHHTLTFGADVRRLQDNLNNFANNAGIFFYLNTQNFEQDKPFFFANFVGNLHEGLRFWNFAPYLQDDWRASPKLTLNLGIRYELNTVPTEAHGRMRNIDQITNISTSLLGQPGANLYQGDHNNFAPRAGFAYAVSPKLVIRGAFGIFFDTSSQLAGELFFNPGITAENLIFGPTFPSGGPAKYPIDPSLLVSHPTSAAPYAASTVIDPRLRNAYTEAYSIGVEQQLGASTAVKLAYVANAGKKLYRQRVLNTFAGNQTVAPNPNFPTGGITLLDNSANSNYNGLQLGVTERMGQRLQGTFSYTWSHAIDEVSTFGGYGSVNSNIFPTNPNNLAADRSSSDFDLRHNVVLSFTYQLPLDRLTAMPKVLRNGWSVNGLISLHTGFPYTPLLGSATVNNGDPNLAAGERPDLVFGTSRYTESPVYGRVANVAMFACPGGGAVSSGCPINGAFGNAGRNSLRAFPYRQTDFSISKDIPLVEGIGLNFRAEFYNLFNTPNFASPGISRTNVITSSQFGLPTATANTSSSGIGQFFNNGGPRTAQLAIRLHF